MKIKESELRKMIAESIQKAIIEEETIEEGKLGKALGTAALGGALMFGGGNIAKAQNTMPQDTISQQISQPTDSLSNQPNTLQISKQKQNEKYVFRAIDFEKDYTKVKSLPSKYGNDHRGWAKELLQVMPLDENGIIHLDYIIVCNQDLDIQRAMEVSVDWFNYAFSNAAAVKKCDYENGIIMASGTYSNIAQYNLNAIYYIKTVKISADTDIVIRFKDNRIRIDVMIRNYHIILADSTMQSRNSLISISDAYPITDSDNKIAYSRAFINCYANSFDKVEKYIKFMETNMNANNIGFDDNW